MGLFDFLSKGSNELAKMQKVVQSKDSQIKQLKNLVGEKDKHFDQVISDGLRHGSSLAGKHMAEKKYKKNK